MKIYKLELLSVSKYLALRTLFKQALMEVSKSAHKWGMAKSSTPLMKVKVLSLLISSLAFNRLRLLLIMNKKKTEVSFRLSISWEWHSSYLCLLIRVSESQLLCLPSTILILWLKSKLLKFLASVRTTTVMQSLERALSLPFLIFQAELVVL